jgi:hypothetical protein
MPNAWIEYVSSLAVSIIFILGGLAVFRRFALGKRDSKGKKYGPGAGYAGVLFVLVGAALGLAIVLTSPTPWERQRIFEHIFRMPPEQVERFVLKSGRPDQYQPLAKSEVVIGDAARIRQITEILRTAREVSPNHPHSKWTARIEMVTGDGTYYFGVDATVPGDPNGTLVAPSTKADGGGWNLGDVRADGLEKILEEAVSAAGHP